MYATSIKSWTRWFAVSDPLSEIVTVENFLGLRNYLNKHNFVFDEDKGFYCILFDYRHNYCLGKSKGIPHPDLNPQVEAKLRKVFKPINRDFYKAVQHDWLVVNDPAMD